MSLGIENNGFGKIYDEWRTLHEEKPDLYPEYMVDDHYL